MKIGILIAFAGRNCGGPEVYEREIVRALLEVAPENEYHLFCLDQSAARVIDRQDDQIVYHLLRPQSRVVSMLTTLPLAISRVQPDVFYAPVMTPPFCPPRTIMAMACSSLIRRPEFFPPLVRMRIRFLLHRAVPKAAKVICPSEHVRDVVHEKFNLPLESLPVIYPGLSPLFRVIDEEVKRRLVEDSYGIRYPYFLFSGRWERRKNVVKTLEAFALFKRNSQTEHRLVFTGGRSWDHREAEEAIQRLGIKDMVADLGKTPFDELPYLYGAADALTYASLWEGFGMPIVEAMACGTPVITSNISAMPEVAADAALLVDPESPEDIAAAMYRMATEPELRHALSEHGAHRARLFSWQKSARKIMDLYEEVARK